VNIQVLVTKKQEEGRNIFWIIIFCSFFSSFVLKWRINFGFSQFFWNAFSQKINVEHFLKKMLKISEPNRPIYRSGGYSSRTPPVFGEFLLRAAWMP